VICLLHARQSFTAKKSSPLFPSLVLQYNNVLIYAEIDRICLNHCKELGECFEVYVEGT
jgi:hypothetical protein